MTNRRYYGSVEEESPSNLAIPQQTEQQPTESRTRDEDQEFSSLRTRLDYREATRFTHRFQQ